MDANLEFALRKTLGLQPQAVELGTAANQRNETQSFGLGPKSQAQVGEERASRVDGPPRSNFDEPASIFVDGMTLPPSEATAALLSDFIKGKFSDSRWHDKQCPWCKSTMRNVRFDVPGLEVHCYNDWHEPLCICGRMKYDHGQEWNPCKRYVEDHSAHYDEMRLKDLERRADRP